MSIDWDEAVLAPLMQVFGEDPDRRPRYMPAAGGAFDIDGVFDRPYKGLVVDADGEPDIATREPVIGVRLSQFPAPPLKGDKVHIPSASETYVVSDVHPDGKGWAKLLLMVAAP